MGTVEEHYQLAVMQIELVYIREKERLMLLTCNKCFVNSRMNSIRAQETVLEASSPKTLVKQTARK